MTDLRHPILYAEQMWKRQRLWAFFLVIAGVGFTILFTGRSRKLDSNALIFLFYIPSGLLLLGILMYYRRRSYLQVTEAGLRVSNLFSSVLIDWDLIRSPRVQPLRLAFQEKRKRMVTPLIRPLMEEPALFIRFRGDDDEVARISKKLGTRFAFEGMAAFPIPDPEAAIGELAAWVPTGSAAAASAGRNLGGARRTKRRR